MKRPKRVKLTHFEVRRDGRLRLKLAIADEAFADVSDELAMLLRKLSPGAPTPPPEDTAEFFVTPQHVPDDADYHAGLREHLTDLLGSLCDASLDDALEIAHAEQVRRTLGSN